MIKFFLNICTYTLIHEYNFFFFFQDKIPPSITCPSDIIVENVLGKKYAYVNWTTPNVTDNVDKTPTLWSKPYITFPWRVKIGIRTVVYMAQDSSGNKAKCKFKVKVLGKLNIL